MSVWKVLIRSVFFDVWEGEAKINRWSGGRGRKKIYEKKPAKGGRRYKKTMGGGTKKNLEARLPTAPLRVEIQRVIWFFYSQPLTCGSLQCWHATHAGCTSGYGRKHRICNKQQVRWLQNCIFKVVAPNWTSNASFMTANDITSQNYSGMQDTCIREAGRFVEGSRTSKDSQPICYWYLLRQLLSIMLIINVISETLVTLMARRMVHSI